MDIHILASTQLYDFVLKHIDDTNISIKVQLKFDINTWVLYSIVPWSGEWLVPVEYHCHSVSSASAPFEALFVHFNCIEAIVPLLGDWKEVYIPLRPRYCH